MSNCVFCKIINNEIPSKKVYEDDSILAILDISQVTPGHTLIIPKKHVPNIYEYTPEFAAEIFSRLPAVAKAVGSFDPSVKGLNILINNGELASQTVFHSHIHLLPRYTEDDDFGLKWADNSSQYDEEKLKTIQQSIKDNVEG
ncbi:HIT family protein [Lacticigenium naphthae]|uniref:HIT family protein n=1 Tax=Lacticigenium naphthae TaxID=515351 RepID=UPI000411D7A6|nr:HIT family protein [Lacticigenium naphthae]